MRFDQPSLVDRVFNRLFGCLVKVGFGLSHNFLLEVRGRKTGRLYSTPVNLLDHNSKQYLVAPRGYTQWVRNVMASEKAALVRGKQARKYSLASRRR
jgi:deazaflavin-dependent oxidoreductase (nitroreductase family)